MKKHSLILFAVATFTLVTNAQSLKGILKNASKKDSSGNILEMY